MLETTSEVVTNLTALVENGLRRALNIPNYQHGIHTYCFGVVGTYSLLTVSHPTDFIANKGFPTAFVTTRGSRGYFCG